MKLICHPERSEGSLLLNEKRFFAGAQNDRNQPHNCLLSLKDGGIFANGRGKSVVSNAARQFSNGAQ
jgi:hypothetical protein